MAHSKSKKKSNSSTIRYAFAVLFLTLLGAGAFVFVYPEVFFGLSIPERKELDTLRKLSLEVLDGKDEKKVLQEIFARIPVEKWVVLQVSENGRIQFDLRRARATNGGTQGALWGKRQYEVGSMEVTGVGRDGHFYPWNSKMTKKDVQGLAQGPFKPIALGVKKMGRMHYVSLKPVKLGTKFKMYRWEGRRKGRKAMVEFGVIR